MLLISTNLVLLYVILLYTRKRKQVICSALLSPNDDVPRRNFDRRIDLARFRWLLSECDQSKSQKNRFSGFPEFESPTLHWSIDKRWFLVVFDMPHKMVSRISAQTKMWPVKNPKNSQKRAKMCARHFWAREAFNSSENSIIVISAIFPYREVSAWPTFLKLFFFTPQSVLSWLPWLQSTNC